MGRLLNVTIDDTLGDNLSGEMPEYNGPYWHSRSAVGTPCDACTAQPDPAFALNGTWHDQLTRSGEEPTTISFTFSGANAVFIAGSKWVSWSQSDSGTAVYIFCIMGNGIPNLPINVTRLSFYLDNSLSGNYFHDVDKTLYQYLYNHLVFNREGLTADNHTLRIVNQPADTGSLILFDYAVYTTEVSDDPVSASPSAEVSDTPAASPSEPPPSAPSPAGVDREHPANVKLILGVSVGGGLAALLLLVVIFRIYSQSLRRSVPQPYVPPPATQQGPNGGGHALKASKSSPFPPSPSQGNGEDESSRVLSEILERVRQLAEPPGYTRPPGSSWGEGRDLTSSAGSGGGTNVTDQALRVSRVGEALSG
ncbi:hypothetical protein AURDEDRAFT_130446 [Auricularia subglabra TFB-10046 SS5]|nr:hypothetical protein AURDEDRAFT_130446 [Auricularia subglabra TFB-10046 SS5]